MKSLILLALFLGAVNCANIFIFMGPITSHSPTASIQPLADGLTRRGHKVILFSPILIPTRHPDIVYFNPSEMEAIYKSFLAKYGRKRTLYRVQKSLDSTSLTGLIYEIFDDSQFMCKMLINNLQFIKMVEDGFKIDLMIIDSGLNDCGFPLAFYFRAKTIIYGATGTVMPWEFQTFGLPTELSSLPGFTSKFVDENVSFMDRIVNAGVLTALGWIYRSYHLPNIEKIFRESYLNEHLKGMPNIEKLVQNTSLMLINQHYSDQFPRSYPPFVVNIGGMHFEEKPNGSLSQEMEAFLGDSDFIYISFGSFIHVSVMPSELIETFTRVLSNSNLKFLWKWEGKFPEKYPSNIFFHNWFPQQNVLADKRIRGFITQGGQISMQQGVCHGVPLIMIPVDGDQDYNAMRMRSLGNAVVLELSSLTSNQLEAAIKTVLHDESIAVNVKKMAMACRDRPASPVETAVWWTEWVLRTNDTSFLKPLSIGQPL